MKMSTVHCGGVTAHGFSLIAVMQVPFEEPDDDSSRDIKGVRTHW